MKYLGYFSKLIGMRSKLSKHGEITTGKSTTRDPRLYFPSEKSHTQDFYALKKPIDPTWFEPTNLKSKGKHNINITDWHHIIQGNHP